MKFVKRIFAVSLAATLMVAPITSFAATKTTEELAQQAAAEAAEAKVEEAKAVTVASTTAVIDGKTVKTNVAGTVDVSASKTYSAVIVQSAQGKTAGDKQVIYSKTAKESPAAFASAEAAAASIGGTIVGDAINANLTLKNGGTAEFVLKNALTGKVKVVQIGDKGVTTILDATVNGKTVSFTPTNGHYTYFIVQG